MLKTIALTAALALSALVAPLPGSEAQAARETYRQCMFNAFNACIPQGPLGPQLPDPGSPEEAAYEACMASWTAYCETLPDAP
ncbi:hypothetical protein [Brevundimonas sp.]|uniref:hypothetical protein n=1 Tax=Brevundimonas sp. TaxID=1871086 RepID=UPI0025C3B50B|nr:hypothetical protein [Brevundimonas sp.]